MVAILLAAGLWIFQFIRKYQRGDSEHEALKEDVQKVDEKQQDS